MVYNVADIEINVIIKFISSTQTVSIHKAIYIQSILFAIYPISYIFGKHVFNVCHWKCHTLTKFKDIITKWAGDIMYKVKVEAKPMQSGQKVDVTSKIVG